MLKSLAQLVAFTAAVSNAQQQQGPTCSQGAAAFDASVLDFSVVATTEPLTPGFAILEGPTWYNGRLYMSHIGYSDGVAQAPSEIVVLGDDGVIRTHQADTGTNGLKLTRRNDIVAARQGRAGEPGRVSLISLDNADFEYTFTDEFDGVGYNSPNDVEISNRYNVYFTDPDWQAPNGAEDDGIGPPQAEERTYYLLRGDRDATAFGVGVIEKPNGILLSADESQLYVGGLNGLFVFPVTCSGAVRDEPTQLHADVITGGVDGMTRDCAGNIYLTANGQVIVLDGETDDILASVAVDSVTNLAFGGADGTTLYATSLGEVPTVYSSPSAISGERFERPLFAGQQSVPRLEACLARTTVASALPGSAEYAEVYQFQLVASREAAAIAFPTNVSQIEELLACARWSNSKVSVLAGQHSFVGYGFGDPGNLVISVDALDSVTVNDADGTVTFGAGARVGPVADALWNANGRLVPHVRGASVGMVGSFIGGGFGILSRFLGMPSDNVVNVKYLLADGTMVSSGGPDSDVDDELLFASQGAGSSYGVIVEMTARTWEPLFQENFFVDVRSTSSLDTEELTQAFLAVQEWATTSAPVYFGLRFHIGSTFRLSMFYLDDPANFNATLDSLFEAIPTEMAINELTPGTPFDMEVRSSGPIAEPKGGTVGTRAFYVQSVTLAQPVGEDAARVFLSNLTSDFDRDLYGLRIGGFMDFSGGPGSVFPSIANEDAALQHGDMTWLVRVDGRFLSGDEPARDEEFVWADANDALFKSFVTPFEEALVADGHDLRGFANYRDRALSFDEWSGRLYGANFDRLLDTKCDVDPRGMFTSNAQSIPAQDCASR